MNYRVIWNYQTKVVVAVIEDQAGTITNYNEQDHEHAVLTGLTAIREILLGQGYDVGIIDDYISNQNA